MPSWRRFRREQHQALSPALAGSNLQLKWPAFSPGYVLETAPTLPASTNAWTAVTNQTPVLSNGWYTVTLPANAAAAFFRLHRP